MAFVNFKTCCSDTKQLIRLLVLIICVGVSCYQLAQCFRKIRYPPISTHYGFRLNDTLRYPAVTICRSPAYKTELFDKFGFTNNKEILISQTWRSFKYNEYTLQQFFEETTYTYQDIFQMAALDQRMSNLNISASFALEFGRCFTMTPTKESKQWGFDYGYFFYMSHTDNEKGEYKATSAGFHVFIQDDTEKFTEKSQQADIFKEYIYVEAGSGIQASLKMNKYNQLPTRNNECNPQQNHSKSRCMEDSVNKLISESVGCSTPWVPNAHLTPCNTYEQTRQIVEYSTEGEYLDNFLKKIECGIRCNATLYIPYVQSIREVKPPNCGIRIYFSSPLYTVMEEVLGYDWNSFLSDLGGSLGFLLGLSVIGMIALAEELVDLVIRIKGAKKVHAELNNDNKIVATKNDLETENEDALNRKNEIQAYKMELEFYSKNDSKTAVGTKF